jgi:hypothetical protein
VKQLRGACVLASSTPYSSGFNVYLAAGGSGNTLDGGLGSDHLPLLSMRSDDAVLKGHLSTRGQRRVKGRGCEGGLRWPPLWPPATSPSSNMPDSPDAFAFVFLRDVEACTTVHFTHNGWQAAGGFRSGEGTATYIAPTDIAAEPSSQRALQA